MFSLISKILLYNLSAVTNIYLHSIDFGIKGNTHIIEGSINEDIINS